MVTCSNNGSNDFVITERAINLHQLFIKSNGNMRGHGGSNCGEGDLAAKRDCGKLDTPLVETIEMEINVEGLLIMQSSVLLQTTVVATYKNVGNIIIN